MVDVKNKYDYFETDEGVESYAFPYNVKFHKLSCFFVVGNDGKVATLGRCNYDSERNTALINAVKSGNARLFAAWRRQYETKLCETLNLKELFEKCPKIFKMSNIGADNGEVKECFLIKEKEEQCDDFPYEVSENPLSCYVVVTNDGQVARVGHCKYDYERNRELLREVENGNARLFVAWAGTWHTEFYQVRNIEKFMEENSNFL